MNNKIVIGIGVVILILVGLIFVMNKRSQNTLPGQNTQETTQTPNSVTIENFSFRPPTLTVKAGDTVTWTNQDSTAHTIKSDVFNSQALKQGDTFRFTFTTKGRFEYSCGIHPSMTGTVVVE